MSTTPSEEVTVSAVAVQERLVELKVERALAVAEGLGAVERYMADLDDEIAAHREAYLAAAVTEIAVLRRDLSGPLVG